MMIDAFAGRMNAGIFAFDDPAPVNPSSRPRFDGSPSQPDPDNGLTLPRFLDPETREDEENAMPNKKRQRTTYSETFKARAIMLAQQSDRVGFWPPSRLAHLRPPARTAHPLLTSLPTSTNRPTARLPQPDFAGPFAQVPAWATPTPRASATTSRESAAGDLSIW